MVLVAVYAICYDTLVVYVQNAVFDFHPLEAYAAGFCINGFAAGREQRYNHRI
jgi:hypothetical protein